MKDEIKKEWETPHLKTLNIDETESAAHGGNADGSTDYS